LALTTKQPKFVPNAFVGREESASHNESLAFVGKSQLKLAIINHKPKSPI